MSSTKDRRTRIIAWAILCIAFAAVLRGIDVMIPHPYAGRGLAIFLGVAVPVAMFLRQWRWRWRAIGTLAGVILVTVVVLHFLATVTVTIKNNSGKRVESLYVMLARDEGGFALAGIRSGQTVTVRFLDMGFDGGLSVMGELEDGTPFPDIRRQPFGGMLAGSGGPTDSVHVLIDAAGMVHVTSASD